jgi:hypothetical protein
MSRFRIGFLPAFFTALGIVFAVALYLRIRSYESRPLPRTAQGTAAAEEVAVSQPPRSTEPAATMTLVELEPNATSTPLGAVVERRPEAATPRKAAPQAAPPRTPREQPKPSLISRIVKPIAKAIGVDRRQTSGAASPSQSQPVAERDPSPPVKDDTSDTLPPQLLSIEFVPPQVHDGEETTMLIAAHDELSGIRSVSGTITAPSGAVQGFACQREGETGRFVSRVTVPKDAAEGVWRVNYLSMIDNASNSATFSAAAGLLPATASFRVISSRPDTDGPTLLGVWLDRRSIKAGEKNIVSVQAEDDKSGVNLVSGVFQSPSRHARVGFVCRNAGGAAWNCEFTAPACGDCGDWQLEQIQLQDKANNMTTIRGDNQLISAVMMDITSDHCDNTPPGLQSVVLDRDVVRSTEDSAIAVTLNLADDVCGVLSVSGQATGPNVSGTPPRLYFSFAVAGDPQTWVGRILVPRLAAKGVWRITWIQVLDRGHNLKTYSTTDPVLSGAAFTVE